MGQLSPEFGKIFLWQISCKIQAFCYFFHTHSHAHVFLALRAQMSVAHYPTPPKVDWAPTLMYNRLLLSGTHTTVVHGRRCWKTTRVLQMSKIKGNNKQYLFSLLSCSVFGLLIDITCCIHYVWCAVIRSVHSWVKFNCYSRPCHTVSVSSRRCLDLRSLQLITSWRSSISTASCRHYKNNRWTISHNMCMGDCRLSSDNKWDCIRGPIARWGRGAAALSLTSLIRF